MVQLISAPNLEHLPSSIDWPHAIYVHIPFCRQRCYYCDFATGLGTSDLIETYVQVLCHEIELIPVDGQPIKTLFFGGGTPSLLSAGQLDRILQALQARLLFAPDIEISLEANPGTVSREQLAGYRAAGVNRISLGVQAFQLDLLKLCGRLHGVNEVYQTIEDLVAVGLTNFNLDLIFGLPHQTLDHWQASLTEVKKIQPRHVSLYDLTIEAGTAFGRRYQPGATPLPTEAETVLMYKLARQELLGSGYDHYEISNFAQPGYACRHNRVYWKNQAYYGLGMGAVGYIHHCRVHHATKLYDYFQTIKSKQLPVAPPVSLQERWQDTLMLGLRLQEGLSCTELADQVPKTWLELTLDSLKSFQSQGWVEWDQQRLWLTQPEGWLFSNDLLATLFAKLDRSTMVSQFTQ